MPVSKPLAPKPKSYSKFLGFAATMIIWANCISVSIHVEPPKYKIVISTHKVSPEAFIPAFILLASALGLDTGKIAVFLLKSLSNSNGNYSNASLNSSEDSTENSSETSEEE